MIWKLRNIEKKGFDVYSKIFPHPVNAQSLSENNSYFLYIKIFTNSKSYQFWKLIMLWLIFVSFLSNIGLYIYRLHPYPPTPPPKERKNHKKGEKHPLKAQTNKNKYAETLGNSPLFSFEHTSFLSSPLRICTGVR